MKHEFVKTENHRRFRAGIDLLQQRGALEAGLMLVIGRPGEGKTVTVMNYAAEVGAVYLEAMPNWTIPRLVEQLADKLGLAHGRDVEKRITDAIGGGEIPIVVDEAQFGLKENALCLEYLRRVTDKSKTLLIMIAMEQDRSKIAKHPQISSRIGYICEFERSSVADVGATCGQLCEVEIAPDLVDRIHREADARMRLVVNAIARVEQAGRRAGKPRMELADMAGVALCEDFQMPGLKKRGKA